MLERYVKTVEKHLTKVVPTNHKYWNERLTIFLLAYRVSTHGTEARHPPAWSL
jgi:hypothetical protein